MKILSIGNSFSQDAHRYLHLIAQADKCELRSVNLFIGGCSLRTHYLNMLDDAYAYTLEHNGESVGVKVSLRQALVGDEWDYVTLQQASPLSGKQDTYFPYIEELVEYVRKFCPNTRILVHETWAYENGSDRLKNLGFNSSEEMYNSISSAYLYAANAIRADGIIPCGKAMFELSKLGVSVHRDQFHASLGVGRYLLALVWYSYLTGNSIMENVFDKFDLPVSNEERRLAIRVANEILND